MSVSKHSEQRSKDVLLALAASSTHVKSVGRLQLQKLIYLFDILAIAWRNVSGSDAFQPWKHGPYDRAIQNAADRLAFRGLVAINRLSFSGTRKAHALYSLTSAGKVAVEQLRTERPFADDLALFDEISEEVNRRGWSHIKDIVYAEPTYNTARITKQGTALSVDQKYNLSWQLIKGVRAGFEIAGDNPMSKRTLVQVFFATVDEYRVSPDANLAAKIT